MNRLKVFVITYNRADYLKESIQSILNQTYRDFELVVLDNCSTDHTEQVVKQFDDSRITYIRHEKNVGGLGNIQYAYTHADTQYYVVFHDDDIMMPEMLEKEMAVLDANPEVGAVSVRKHAINENGLITRYYQAKTTKPVEIFTGDEFFCSWLHKQEYMAYPAVMYRTEAMQGTMIKGEAGPSADILVFFDLEKKGKKLAIINEALLNYRVHSNQDSQLSRVAMSEKLWNYLKADDYYRMKLDENAAGQKKYCNRLMYIEACLAIKGVITPEAAAQNIQSFQKLMEYRIFDAIRYNGILLLVRLFPKTMKKVYDAAKKSRSQK